MACYSQFGKCFKHIQETYGLKHLPQIRAATTRWLSHGRACARLVERYLQVIDTLDAALDYSYDPKVFGVRETLMEKNNMATVLILCDMLAPIILFSDFLQGNNDFALVVERTKVLIHELEHLKARFRAHLQTPDPSLTLSNLEDTFLIIDDRNDLARRLRGGPVYTSRQIVEELACPMISSLIVEITDSFHCSPVLAAFSTFHLPNVPTDVADLADYGQAEIQALASHYGNTKRDTFKGHQNAADAKYTEDTYIREFQAFKHQLFMFKQRIANDDPKPNMTHFVLSDPVMKNSFPAMTWLLELYKCIPPSTASVERIFSLMNSQCTSERNRLSQDTLNSLLLITSHKKT